VIDVLPCHLVERLSHTIANRTDIYIDWKYRRLLYHCIGFEVLGVVTVNVFWNLMPYSLIEVYRRFGVIYCLHLP
jgi:hypothetical protein